MTIFRWLRRCLRRELFFTACAMLAMPAWADYDVQRGDVLDIAVPGAAVLNRRVTVHNDGTIVYPIVGQMAAAGRSLSALELELQTMLVTRNVVDKPNVIVSVAEFGPVYVSGDVLHPGELRFRPDMTVGMAIALSGGFDLRLGEARLTDSQRSEIRAQLGEAQVESLRQQARIGRLKAELAGSRTPDMPAADPSVDPSVRGQIVGIETAQLQADLDSDDRERTRLQQQVEAARAQVAALEAAGQQQRRTYESQLHYSTRTRNLVGRGVATNFRAEDSERAAASAQAQVLEVGVRAAQARRELQEADRANEAFADRRRARLLQSLTDAITDMAKVRFRIDSANERLFGLAGGRMRQSDVAANATIRRVVDGRSSVLEATTDTKLQTGDVIEIVLDRSTMRTSASRE